MDLHAGQVQGFFDIPVDHLYAAPVIVRNLQSRNFVNPVVVSPDVGGLKMASSYAENLGAGLAIVAKRRKSATETEAMNVIGEVEGRHCILVDDEIATGNSLIAAAELLVARGATAVSAGVVHSMGRAGKNDGRLVA
jgi:ribose-phosphate pyrophosphokinase